MKHYCTLQLFPLFGLFGVCLTIFYKKEFTFRKQFGCRLVSFACLGMLWAISWFTKDVFPTLLASEFTFIYVVREFLRKDVALEEKLKSLVLSTALFLCTTLSGDMLACLAVICAMTQLLRWPVSLKNRLRELRIIFGPVYPILVLGGCIQLDFTSHLLKLSSCLSLMAAVLLRPDNKEMLKLVEVVGFSVPSTNTRKLIHGLSMFVSLICIMVHLTMSLDIPRMILAGTAFVGGLNVLLYAFVAELPRKIYRNCVWLQWTTTQRKATSCTGIKPYIKCT